MRQSRRFERKILLAILGVGVFAIVGGIVFGGVAVREAYRVGVNRDVGAQLERGLEGYRRYFVAEREHAASTLNAIAHDHALLSAIERDDESAIRSAIEALFALYPNVLEIEITTGEKQIRKRGAQPGSAREMRREMAVDAASSVAVTFAGPEIPMSEYQRAGQTVDVYARLERNTRYVSGTYVELYVAILIVVVLAAVVLAIVASRRVTRRMALVVQAAKQVGSGRLDVSIPVDSNDEIAELTLAFNEMVADMKTSRDRIDYLQRIGAWQEFARRLAHEIKNPLTPIQLAIQEVHRRYSGDDQQYGRALDDAKIIIEEEVATLRRLVGEFSSFAKLPEPQLEHADLAEFATDAMKSLSIEHGDGHALHVRLDAPSERVPVNIDAMMLKRCVDNLVRNAAQALKNANVAQAQIEIRVRRENHDAVLEVSDNGPGVPEDARARVFEPYYTTKADGTGLGLAIVKKIVLEHGGEISYAPSKTGGACFRIALPLLRNEVA